ALRPDWIIHCGRAARSCWETVGPRPGGAEDASQAVSWAKIAAETGAAFAFISSDAIFSGPWMFHGEGSRHWCRSREAEAIRETEAAVEGAHPQALVVRTNAFGWMPDVLGAGWVECSLADLEQGDGSALDGVRHATPILASDLAGILELAWQTGLTGVRHIAGAERTSPLWLAERLAERFGLPRPSPSVPRVVETSAAGFGAGETSLRTIQIRRDLNVPMPSPVEGVWRLAEQRDNGYCDRLNGKQAPAAARAA
ncbi:MAG: sugar nucleotide-binding protein, partial [Planctomycetes bacterium]|nr:sugar nucleotide-binding protein [Planctomycetota bacterium]